MLNSVEHLNGGSRTQIQCMHQCTWLRNASVVETSIKLSKQNQSIKSKGLLSQTFEIENECENETGIETQVN